MNTERDLDTKRHANLCQFNEDFTNDIVIPDIYHHVLRDYRQQITDLATKHRVGTSIITRIVMLILQRDTAGIS